MQQTRRELLDQFLGFVGESGDTKARTRAGDLLNAAVHGIWLKARWSAFESPTPFRLTLVANQASYALPDYFGRIGPGYLRNLTNGTRFNPPLSVAEAQERYPYAGTADDEPGNPVDSVLAGTVGVTAQPIAGGEALEVVSSDASDTNIVVVVEGNDLYGSWVRTQVTLNGTTPVALGSWLFVDGFGKSYQASATPVTALTTSRGTVVLRAVSPVRTLQTLLPAEAERQHRVITFYPTPVSADIIAIPLVRRPKRLLYDADPLPLDWGPAVFEEMKALWYENRGEASTAAALPRPAFLDLLAHENTLTPRRVRPFQL